MEADILERFMICFQEVEPLNYEAVTKERELSGVEKMFEDNLTTLAWSPRKRPSRNKQKAKTLNVPEGFTISKVVQSSKSALGSLRLNFHFFEVTTMRANGWLVKLIIQI